MTKSLVKTICLTGGPCGGKTTSLSRLSEHLEKHGFRVYRVPEAATLFFMGGVERGDLAEDYYTFGFQEEIMKAQIGLEQRFYKLAKDIGKPAVVICDRGLMDCKAFIKPKLWQSVLSQNNWTEEGLRDKYYDAIIHLTTAAIGAEQFYTNENNKARTETKKEAAEIDNKLLEVWTGHPHLRVINNSTDFEGKIKRTLEAICRVVGIPEPLEVERKFLIEDVGEIPVPHEKLYIEQTYYQNNSTKENFRIRCRGRNNNYVYTYTEKKEISPGVRTETERQITPQEELILTRNAKELGKIIKYRTCFIWESQYFELDEFKKPCEGLRFLEIELNNYDDKYKLPPFIKIEKEVTEDFRFSNSWIAQNYLSKDFPAFRKEIENHLYLYMDEEKWDQRYGQKAKRKEAN